ALNPITSKPVGKVRRRVQEIKNPSVSLVSGDIDLSHNESTRLAMDALLNQGLDMYQEVLAGEGEGFLPEKHCVKNLSTSSLCGTESDDQAEGSTTSSQTDTCCPSVSESEPPGLDHGWPAEDWSYRLQGEPSVEVYFQSDRAASMKDLLREFISKATMVLAIVMDTFSDVEMFCDILEATRKRNVFVYLLLDHINLQVFVNMCEMLQINSNHLTKMSVRSIQGETYCAKSGRKLTGQIKEKFMIIDCTLVLAGSYSFTWLSWQVHRSLAVLFKGSAVEPFDLEFRKLYASSKPVPAFLSVATEINLTRPLITHQAAATSTPLTNLPCPSPGTTTQNRNFNNQAMVQPTTTVVPRFNTQSTVQPTTTTQQRHPNTQPTAPPTSQQKHPNTQPTSQQKHPNTQPTSQQRHPNTQPTAPPTSQQRHPNTQPTTSQQRHPNTQPTTSQQRHPNTQPTTSQQRHPNTQPTTSQQRHPNTQPTTSQQRHPNTQPTTSQQRHPNTQPTTSQQRHPNTQPTTSQQRHPNTQPTTSQQRHPNTQPTTSQQRHPNTQPTTSQQRHPNTQPTTSQQRHPNTQPTSQHGHPNTQPTSQQRHPNTQPTSQQRHPNTQPTSQQRHPNTQPTSQQRHPNTQPTSQCLVNQPYYTGPRSHRFDWITQRHTATRPVMFQRTFSSDYSTGDNLTWRPFNSNYLLYGGTTGLLDRHPLLKTGQWFTVPK
uniref:Protein FAM83A-like n=1 Tax=Salmo trutta TaxID=8032 RepID=A0A674BVS2_SALTR